MLPESDISAYYETGMQKRIQKLIKTHYHRYRLYALTTSDLVHLEMFQTNTGHQNFKPIRN